MLKFLKQKTLREWQTTLRVIIFEADTPAGKLFDLILICSILCSVVVVMLDSVSAIRAEYGLVLRILEWFFTLIFTLEYALRLFSIGHPIRYATSFFGIVDLLAVLPAYLNLFMPGIQYLLAFRILRVLRIFRILKLVKYSKEVQSILEALLAARRKSMVFLFMIITVLVIFGSLMYVIEGEENGFTSIPRSIYWAAVTLTTVGYGDIAPRTILGQTLATIAIILGYAIIAVPVGMATLSFSSTISNKSNTRCCPQCSAEGHDNDAHYCKYCSARLDSPFQEAGTLPSKKAINAP